jgi:hypothetical protein
MVKEIIYDLNIKIDNNSEKEISFTCDNKTLLFIDDPDKGIWIDAGRHSFKVIRHHDFFFDWFVDSKLVEEFMIIDLSCDDHIISIKSSTCLKSEDESVNIESSIRFPLSFNLIDDHTKIVINCEKQSQLSFYFSPDKSDFSTLTLQFSNESYCKVYLDVFKNGAFKNELRTNMGLFNTSLGIDNIFSFDKSSENIIVSNSKGEKSYSVKGILDKVLIVDETWTPSGQGKYIINQVV